MKRLIVFLMFLVLLSACSPAARPTSAPPAAPAAEQQMGKPQESAGNANQKEPASPAKPAPAGTPSGPSTTTSELAYSEPGSQLVIKDALLDILVQDSAAAINRVTALATDMGGYIISSQTWYQDGYLYGSLRLGIPSARFESALNALRQTGISVLKESAQGQDVTDQYVDMQSRLTNLEATAARVREFLKNAKTIDESLKISQQLSDLEAQIEQVKGQMRYFEGRAAYSTVTVNLTPQYPTPTPTMTATATPSVTPTPPWNPGKTFNSASGVLAHQFQAFTDTVIWLTIVVGPWAALLVLAYLIGRGILRRAKII